MSIILNIIAILFVLRITVRLVSFLYLVVLFKLSRKNKYEPDLKDKVSKMNQQYVY